MTLKNIVTLKSRFIVVI